MSNLAHVYIMEDRGAFKVGHSKDPHGRRKQLGAHLTVVHASEPMANAGRVERLAHRLLALAGKRLVGELFTATLEEAKAAIERAERIAAGVEPDVTIPLTVEKSRELRKPRWTRPFMMRVDEAFLAKLDDLRVAERPVKSRSDYIRKLVEDASPPYRGDKRAARR